MNVHAETLKFGCKPGMKYVCLLYTTRGLFRLVGDDRVTKIRLLLGPFLMRGLNSSVLSVTHCHSPPHVKLCPGAVGANSVAVKKGLLSFRS